MRAGGGGIQMSLGVHPVNPVCATVSNMFVIIYIYMYCDFGGHTKSQLSESR